MAAIPKFKARPVDPRIMESAGDLGVPKIARKAVTTPRPFSFAGDKQHQTEKEKIERLRKEKAENDENKPQFKARPFKQYVSLPFRSSFFLSSPFSLSLSLSLFSPITSPSLSLLLLMRRAFCSMPAPLETKKSDRPLTEIHEFRFSTDLRTLLRKQSAQDIATGGSATARR